MIRCWRPGDHGMVSVEHTGGPLPTASCVWFDVEGVSADEERLVESALGIDVPTRDEMQQLGRSNRLFREGSALVMHSTMLIHTESGAPETTPVTFVLTRSHIVTLRYAEPTACRHVAATLARNPAARSAEDVFIAILEAVIERLADHLERTTREMEDLSVAVFRRDRVAEADLHEALRTLGSHGLVVTKVRDSLVDKHLLMGFAEQNGHEQLSPDARGELHLLIDDARSLGDHASYMGDKATFLLDAIVGLIGIEQNRVIKVLSIVATLFLPPTLVASIYGMNFDRMPELHWAFGYPFAIGLMLVTALCTLLLFRKRRWM
jgi:magnesium transporter